MKTDPAILTHPHIPKALHGTAPRTLLSKEWWDDERYLALVNANDHCMCCGVHKNDAIIKKRLECHEMYDINYEEGIATYTKTVAICYACHSFIHSGYLLTRFQNGEIHRAEFLSILHHGAKILKYNGLKAYPFTHKLIVIYKIPFLPKKQLEPSVVAPFDKWVMVVENTVFTGKWKTRKDYKNHYGVM